MLKSEKINSYIDERGFNLISSLIAFSLAVITLISNVTVGVDQPNHGLLLDSANLWLGNSTLSWAINLLPITATTIGLILCNNQFQFIRTFTTLLATIFVTLMVCNTVTIGLLCDGNILVLVNVISIALLYLTLQNGNTLIIFSIFTLITTCSIFNYAYLTLLPIFILGVMQMQAMNLKSMLAILLGVIAPFWVIFGLHLGSTSDIHSVNMVSIASAVVDASSPIFIYNITTATITFVLLVKNMITIYNFPPQVRAYNGVLTLLTLWSLIMPMIDYYNSNCYIPTLYMCCAIQIAHAFTSSRNRFKYIWIVAMLAVYISLYIWQLL